MLVFNFEIILGILQSLGSSLFVRFWCRWGSRVRAATPGRKHRVNLESALLVFGYSPRHFTYLDPRIETHLKKYFIPENEDVRAYLRVSEMNISVEFIV